MSDTMKPEPQDELPPTQQQQSMEQPEVQRPPRLTPMLSNTIWAPNEDAALVQLVVKLGTKKWVQISNLLQTKTAKQCRERWINHLNPEIRKDAWTPEEDNTIIEAHKTIGTKWSEISRMLPGRTDNAIKNRWNNMMRRAKNKLQGKVSRRAVLDMILSGGEVNYAPNGIPLDAVENSDLFRYCLEITINPPPPLPEQPAAPEKKKSPKRAKSTPKKPKRKERDDAVEDNDESTIANSRPKRTSRKRYRSPSPMEWQESSDIIEAQSGSSTEDMELTDDDPDQTREIAELLLQIESSLPPSKKRTRRTFYGQQPEYYQSDVVEPLPVESKQSQPDVTTTTNSESSTAESDEKLYEKLSEQIAQVLKGQPKDLISKAKERLRHALSSEEMDQDYDAKP